MVKLTICIPTVSSRKSLLSRLLWGIEAQLTKEVEVLIYPGDDVAMGDKYNRMFQEASGLYVTCVDDDDYLADNYIEQVLGRIKRSEPDYVGYKILHTENGKYMTEVSSSISGDFSWQTQPFGPLAKCVIRRDVAKECFFPNHHSGDYEWARDVQKTRKLQSEEIINRVLYYYDFWLKGSLGTEPGSTNKQRDLGIYPYHKENFRWLTS